MEKKRCKRCGVEFESKFLDVIKKWSTCCELCSVRNFMDNTGLPTPPAMLDRFSKGPTLSQEEYQREIENDER